MFTPEQLSTYVEKRFLKFTSEHDVPRDLMDDLKQEMALAAWMASSHYDGYDEIIPAWKLNGRISRMVDHAAMAFLKQEKEYADPIDLYDSKELKERVDLIRLSDASIACAQKEVDTLVNQFIGTLTDREQDILFLSLSMSLGLSLGEHGFYSAIGKKFGITRDRSRQICTHLLHKLRHPSRSRRLKDLIEMFDDCLDIQLDALKQ